MSLISTLETAAKALEAAGVEYVIGGSFASSVWGRQRSTQDADVAAWIDYSQLPFLRAALEPKLHFDELGAFESSGDFRALQIVDPDSLDRIDLFVMPQDDYSRERLNRRRWIDVGASRLPFSSPEDVILLKLRWYELGARVSDRQWNDILQVLQVQGDSLDSDYLDRWAEFFGVEPLLNEARNQATSS